MNIGSVYSVYFVGVGGIGMSAIARWFNQRGVPVGGYDKVITPLTTRLETEGIWVHYVDDVKEIPEKFLNKDNTLIVYTPAIPKKHDELRYFQKKGFTVMKRSEVLGMISKDHYTVAVAGTHGKTTTSSMVAHLLNQTEKGCSAFIGGIMTNYDSNLLVGGENAPVVVEADEFDRSFLRLLPNYSIVTSVDPDHLDIYGDEATIKQAFGDFLKLGGEEGKSLIHYAAAEKINMHLEHLYYTYGIDKGDIQAKALRAVNGAFIFNYHGSKVIKDLKLSVPGFHNVENCIAAVTLALDLGMDAETIKSGIESYRGVKRRFQFIVKNDKFTFIDDYAHHPTEITAFLKSVKALYPRKKLSVIFQPHLYSRTRDFEEGFAESLSLADELILLDIYPAREEPIKGVTSSIIFDRIYKENKVLTDLAGLAEVMAEKDVELLCTIGAGNIDMEVPKLKDYYLNKYQIEG
ncbi:MAG: UDP-N-acetylmuramate--alanine ligase [Marinoscillum sp.]|jgi:UDP-N-acetylmuramate--alanine ligase